MDDFDKVRYLIGNNLRVITGNYHSDETKLDLVRIGCAEIHMILFGCSPTGFTATGKRKGGG